MADLIYRTQRQNPLTSAEVDGNFRELENRIKAANQSISSVNSNADGRVARTGDTMTGPLKLPSVAININDSTASPTSFVWSLIQSFGLGSAASSLISDFNEIRPSGLYGANASTANTPLAGATLTVLNIRFNATGGFQMAARLVQATGSIQVWVRTQASDTWTGWREIGFLDSPAFTSIPTAPTAAIGTKTKQLATTEFVAAAIAALVGSSPAALDTINELAAALGNDPNFATTITNSLAQKQPLSDILTAIVTNKVWGLGSSPGADIPAPDLNNINGTTFWRASNNANAPGAGDFIGLHLQRDAFGNAGQFAIEIGNGNGFFTRSRAGTTWSAWMPFMRNTSVFDGGAGRLMQVGSGGLLSGTLPNMSEMSPKVTDLNAVAPLNMRFMGSALTNAPLGNQGWFLVDQLVHNANWITQEAYGMSGLDGRRFWRQRNGTAWGAWSEINHSFPDLGWTGITLQNGWVQFSDTGWGTVAYRRIRGMVECRGLIQNGNASAGIAIFTLPAGYRPATSMMLPVVVANAQVGQVDIAVNGTVSVRSVQAAWTSLHGIRFVAEV